MMLTHKLIGAKVVSGGSGRQQFIAVAHNTGSNITAYPWSSSGFGTKFANPTTLPANTGNGVAFTEI